MMLSGPPILPACVPPVAIGSTTTVPATSRATKLFHNALCIDSPPHECSLTVHGQRSELRGHAAAHLLNLKVDKNCRKSSSATPPPPGEGLAPRPCLAQPRPSHGDQSPRRIG